MHEQIIQKKYQIYLELCRKAETPEEHILSYEEYVVKVQQFIRVQD